MGHRVVVQAMEGNTISFSLPGVSVQADLTEWQPLHAQLLVDDASQQCESIRIAVLLIS